MSEREKLQAAREKRAARYGISVKEGGHLTPPAGYPEDAAQYGDPVNYRYPIDEEHIRPAVSYFNQTGQRTDGGYSAEEWAIVGKRIAKAAARLIGGKYRYSEGKVAREAEAMEGVGGFFFAEVAEEGRPVEVLRVGSFRDMHGKAVEIGDEDLDAFVANFAAGAAGQEVPVDVDHERGEAAGWLRALYREGDKLLARVDWTKLGKELVGERIYRYVSAFIDVAGKVVKSVSLVNFPAVKGLAPVELGEGAYTLEAVPGLMERVVTAIRNIFEEVAAEEVIEGGETEQQVDLEEQTYEEVEMTEEERAALREEIREELLAELAEREQTLAELRAEVRQEVEAELAGEFERRAELRAFAEEITGGEVALSASAEAVTDFLAALPEEQVQTAMEMLKGKVVEFGERGSSREGGGEKLPPEMAAVLRKWLAGGGTVEEFLEMNAAELGGAEYDLSEFKKEE